MFEQHLTGRREAHVSARPVQEPRSELALEVRNGLRQRGLRDVEPFGCAAEVKLLAENREIPKLAELDRRRNGGEPCDRPQVILPGLMHVVFPAHNSPRSLRHSSIRSTYGPRNGADTRRSACRHHAFKR